MKPARDKRIRASIARTIMLSNESPPYEGRNRYSDVEIELDTDSQPSERGIASDALRKFIPLTTHSGAKAVRVARYDLAKIVKLTENRRNPAENH